MRPLIPIALLLLLLPVAARSQGKPDILIVNQPDPLSCCYELRLENRHTPPSMLNHLSLRILTPGVRFQPGAPGPWPAQESDTLIIFGESGLELPPGESADGFIICIELPPGSNGAFKIEWSTSWNSTTITRDTLSIICSRTTPASDSIRVMNITPVDQPDESCCYELTLLNRHEPTGPLNGLQLTLLTPGAAFVGTPTGPWQGSVANPTTVEFITDDAVLNSGGQLGGFRVCVRPPGGVTGGVVFRWASLLGGNLVDDDILNLACTPKVTPRGDSIAVKQGSDCSVSLSVFNTHRPQSNLNGVRISMLTAGASIESVTPPAGWNIFSQTGVTTTFRMAVGNVAPNDSATGFGLKLNPPASGIVRFSVCTMLQNGTISCDTAQMQCDPPPPSSCDSVVTIRTGDGCTYDFGFVNKHVPSSGVNDFHIKLQSLGASISSATAPPGWTITRQTATEIDFRDTVGMVLPGGKQTGFLLSLLAGSAGSQIFYQWCTSLDGGILCCEYSAVNCEQIRPRCDSLAVTTLGDYCTYRFDVGNAHIPQSAFNDVHFSLRDAGTVLLDANAPAGWEIDSLSDAVVIFRKTDGSVATGETAEGFELSLVPSALSNRIAIDWCTSLDGTILCCDTVSVFCEYKQVALDKVDVITDTERPCCFEFSIDNEHLPRSPLTSFSAEIITPGVFLYASTIASPGAWSHVSNDRKVTWRTTSSELPPGENIRGFVVCYDNDASGNADFSVVWQTASSGLIVSQDTVTIKCDRTLAVELPDAPIPDRVRLHQNYPNPFNPATTVRFDLPTAETVELQLFDAHGRMIMDMGSGAYSAGSWVVHVDASQLASGTYFYRLRVGEKLLTRSMLLLR